VPVNGSQFQLADVASRERHEAAREYLSSVRNEDEPFAAVQSARRSANGIYGLLLQVGGFSTGLSFRDSLL
jgi:hypothetical protein